MSESNNEYYDCKDSLKKYRSDCTAPVSTGVPLTGDLQRTADCSDAWGVKYRIVKDFRVQEWYA